MVVSVSKEREFHNVCKNFCSQRYLILTNYNLDYIECSDNNGNKKLYPINSY